MRREPRGSGEDARALSSDQREADRLRAGQAETSSNPALPSPHAVPLLSSARCPDVRSEPTAFGAAARTAALPPPPVTAISTGAGSV